MFKEFIRKDTREVVRLMESETERIDGKLYGKITVISEEIVKALREQKMYDGCVEYNFVELEEEI